MYRIVSWVYIYLPDMYAYMLCICKLCGHSISIFSGNSSLKLPLSRAQSHGVGTAALLSFWVSLASAALETPVWSSSQFGDPGPHMAPHRRHIVYHKFTDP